MINVNEAVDEVRRDESFNNLELCGTRHCWLKNPENLTDNQTSELRSIKHLDSKTARIYHLKCTALENTGAYHVATLASLAHRPYLRK